MAKTIEKTKINSVEDIHNHFEVTGEETGLVLDFKVTHIKVLTL